MNQASDLAVTIVPLQETYHLGEPIAVELSIRATGPEQEAAILASYPEGMGVSFSCSDPDAIPVSGWDLGGRLSTLRVGGEPHVRAIALNRYLAFRSPKSYEVDYVAEYMEPVSASNPSPATFSSKGRLVVRIVEGPVDTKRIDQYADDLESDDQGKRQEAAEMLIWTDDPVAIGPLRRAAREVPDAAPDVVNALGKFFDDARAPDAILEIARDGSAGALRAALSVFQAEKREVPVAFLRSILESRYSGKVYPTLEYLLAHGDARHIEMVRPFESDPNAQIKRLASECVVKMEKRGG
jgi:hypothetical protein